MTIAGLSVGDDIALHTRRFGFDRDVAAHFDAHVAKSVPGYDIGHFLILEESDWHAREGARMIEVGCATGALVEQLAVRHRGSGARIVGVDVAAEMVDFARGRTASETSVEILHADAREVDFTGAGLVIFYYTLQFLPVTDRQGLLAQICRQMEPDGQLILFEKTLAPDARLQDHANQTYMSFKRRQGFSAEEIMSKAESLRGVLEPLTSAGNAALLEDAGFEAPSLLFKYLAFEGLSARRPARLSRNARTLGVRSARR